MMFSGLMSRCTIPAACATASALATCAPIRASASDADRLTDHRGERLSVHEFHDQEAPFVDGVELVDGDDVRMVERRCGARFLLEAADGVGVAGEPGPQQLHGDLAAKPRVVREVDLAHPATADERQHFVMSDACR